MYAGNGGPTRQDSYFLSPFMPKTAEMALPVPTKTFLSRSPDTAMLFAPFGCTHPPPPAPPSLLAQSLSLKDIAGCDIMKLKVSWHLKASLAGKRLIVVNHWALENIGIASEHNRNYRGVHRTHTPRWTSTGQDACSAAIQSTWHLCRQGD